MGRDPRKTDRNATSSHGVKLVPYERNEVVRARFQGERRESVQNTSRVRKNGCGQTGGAVNKDKSLVDGPDLGRKNSSIRGEFVFYS